MIMNTTNEFAPQELLSLEDFFSGRLEAWGLFEDSFGKVRRQFAIDIKAEHKDGALILHEHFRYCDGATDNRVWTLKPLGHGRYEGRADKDVIGVARGQLTENRFEMQYRLRLKIGGGTVAFTVDDRFHRQSDRVMLNRSTLRKFGVPVGNVYLTFLRDPKATELDAAAA